MSMDQRKSREHFELAMRRVEQQHKNLEALRREVNATIASGVREDIRLSVNGYSGAVEAHFDLEEQAYYPSPADVDSDASANLTALLDDHERLRLDLKQLRELVTGGDLDEFAKAFESFTHDLSEHEAREEATMVHIAETQ